MGQTAAGDAARRQHSACGAHMVFAVLHGIHQLEIETPRTFWEATCSSNKKREKWLEACKKEFEGCEAQDTWELVQRCSLPTGTNVIPVKWVFKIKTDENGHITKYKARITPKGFRQRHGVDYFEVFANTGKYKSLRLVLSIAAAKNMELRQYDVPQAFTQAELHEDVYMEMPQGFEVPGMVCRLKKSLYGLKQSPRNWYLKVSEFIKERLGFRATISDPCLFFKLSATEQLMLLFLFVDDMQVGFDQADAEEWEQAHQMLRKEYNISDVGDSKYMLGMRIERDRQRRTIKLSQELYVTKALERFGLQQCRPRSTPAPHTVHTQAGIHCTSSASADLQLYQEKVGTLLYAAISTRPDISFAVNKLTQKMQAPTAADMAAADRVFRYLSGTRDMGLQFGRRSCRGEMPVCAFADADWASDKADRKSITGWVAMVNGDVISWASKKQPSVALSTCEAELYAETAAIQEIKWLRGLLSELGLSSGREPSVLYGDNQSAQELTKNGVKSERTKHIDIKYHFVTDEVQRGSIALRWIPTTEQLADVFTKALGRPQHQALRDQLLTATTTPATHSAVRRA